MTKVLVLHHLEPYWNNALLENGTSYEGFKNRVVAHINKNNYDRVILNYAHHHKKEEPLRSLVTIWNQYGYGFTVFPENIIGVSLTKVGVEINRDRHGNLWYFDHTLKAYLLAGWMFDLIGSEVYIAGAFDGQCVHELETALDVIGVDYKRIEELII